MRNYELMLILDPSVDERTVEPTMRKLLGVVEAHGGSIEDIDIWGKRRLTYEIKKNTEGIYVVVKLTASSDTAQELTRQLNLNESVLRLKLLRPDAA